MLSPLRGLRFTQIELARNLTANMAKIALAAVIIVPLLLGTLYLYAFLDPYGSLEELPAAVVNNDTGAQLGDTRLNIGDDLIDDLDRDNGGLQWHFVDASEAREGLETGRYYVVLTIPEGFSADIASAQSKDPVQAILDLEYNQSANPFATQMEAAALEDVRGALVKRVSSKYYDNIFLAMDGVSTNLATVASDAADLSEDLTGLATGAGVLSSALAGSTEGMNALVEGVDLLVTNGATLATGAQQLASGLSEYAVGAEGLAAATAVLDEQMDSLVTGTQGIALGTAGLSLGANAIKAAVPRVGEAITELNTQTDGLGAKAQATADDVTVVGERLAAIEAALASDDSDAEKLASIQEAMVPSGTDDNGDPLEKTTDINARVAEKADALATIAQTTEQAIDTLDSDFNKGTTGENGMVIVPPLSSMVDDLATQVTQLDAVAQAIAGGASTISTKLVKPLAEGAAQSAALFPLFVTGSSALALGTDAFVSGLGAMSEGTGEFGSMLDVMAQGSAGLAENIEKAQESSDELATGLEIQAEDILIDDREADARIEMMSNPVKMEVSYYTKVRDYGTGLAPYFIALALWVGALVITFVCRPFNQRVVASSASSAVAIWAGYLPMAGIAVVQALLLGVLVQFALKVEVVQVAGFYALLVLAALVCAAIMQALVAILGGTTGRLVSLLWLALQVVCAGGTFPLEMAPSIFQSISPWMPLAYVVEGLRTCLSGASTLPILVCVALLVLFGMIAFLASVAIVYRKQTVRVSLLEK